MKFHILPFDILNSKTKVKIIKFLISHEAFMSEREIASILNVSHMSINRTARELADMNFINSVKVGKANLWRVNRKSYAYEVLSKITKSITSVQEPLENLKKTVLRMLPKTYIKKVVLFGSITKRLERPNSDIDIFILLKDEQDKEKIELSIEKLSNTCLEKYGNSLAPYVLSEKELKQKKNLKIISEINKGIKIFPKR
ncbi:MAG: nucleotidyltransferase domain-containing protein [Candidatus Aminicenantes bacterium]|nr:nucleotidyltransferase domain-containing protein [Candidatus Aminicenantes bacterium]